MVYGLWGISARVENLKKLKKIKFAREIRMFVAFRKGFVGLWWIIALENLEIRVFVAFRKGSLGFGLVVDFRDIFLNAKFEEYADKDHKHNLPRETCI